MSARKATLSNIAFSKSVKLILFIGLGSDTIFISLNEYDDVEVAATADDKVVDEDLLELVSAI